MATDARWYIRIYDTSGTEQYRFTDAGGFLKAACQPTVNAGGAFTLELGAHDEEVPQAIGLDWQFEFYRRVPSADVGWYRFFSGLARRFRWYLVNGSLRLEISGTGNNGLLKRRTIATYSGSSQAQKSGPAETVIKAYVNEQAGPGATTRAITGLTVEADSASGNTISLGRSNKSLFTVCQEIADIGGGDFDVVTTGGAEWEFRWYNGQLGTDRSSDVVFSLDNGNMADPELDDNRLSEQNYVRVGGQGEGSARSYMWRSDSSLADDSPINRMESFADARNSSTSAELNSRGDAVLEQYRPKLNLSFTVLQSPGAILGRDYFLGDLVTASFAGVSQTRQIASILYSHTAPDGESLSVRTEET